MEQFEKGIAAMEREMEDRYEVSMFLQINLASLFLQIIIAEFSFLHCFYIPSSRNCN